MKKILSISFLGATLLALSSCLDEPEYDYGKMTPEIATKWINNASGDYFGYIYVINPSDLSDQKVFESKATLTARDSVLTIQEFPAEALANFASGDDVTMLKNIDKQQLKLELHPYNGNVQHQYTFYMFPIGKTMEITHKWNDRDCLTEINWASSIKLSETAAAKYGVNELFPLSAFKIAERELTGNILIDKFCINGKTYEKKVIVQILFYNVTGAKQ